MKTKRKTSLIITLALLFISVSVIRARHIIGGSISYKNLGEGDCEFTLKTYRDCNCEQCAALDPLAFIGIYQCQSDTDCSVLEQTGFLHRLDVPLDSIRIVEVQEYPCLIPPDVCVEEGLYRFRLSEYNLSLPDLVDESYHITHQRCCRNITVSNIINPDSSGATYTVEITPEAMTQDLGNSSPEFSYFPPIVICAGQPLEFDHSAVDADGDQLVYEFCAPLNGGGASVHPDFYETCEGAYPNPACPPPSRWTK